METRLTSIIQAMSRMKFPAGITLSKQDNNAGLITSVSCSMSFGNSMLGFPSAVFELFNAIKKGADSFIENEV